MARYSAGTFGMDFVTDVFGELDVRRATARSLNHYVKQVATPKQKHVAFGIAIMQFQHLHSRQADLREFRELVAGFEEYVRGALVHWAMTPSFMGFVLEEQRQNGYWPFDSSAR